MASKNLLILAVFTVCVAAATAAHHNAAAPAPSVDCSSLILNLADCLTFVSNDSTATTPEKTCCSGLKTVLKTDAECLCEGFKSSAQFGVVLNVTKALTLPAACKIKAPPASNCGLALSPAGAPGVSPSTPSTAGSLPGLSPQAAAPAPLGGAAHGLAISVGSLVAGAVTLFVGL